MDQQVSGTGSGSRHFQNKKKYQVKTSNEQRIENFCFKNAIYCLAAGTSSFSEPGKTFSTGTPIFLYASGSGYGSALLIGPRNHIADLDPKHQKLTLTFTYCTEKQKDNYYPGKKLKDTYSTDKFFIRLYQKCLPAGDLAKPTRCVRLISVDKMSKEKI